MEIGIRDGETIVCKKGLDDSAGMCGGNGHRWPLKNRRGNGGIK